MNEESGGLFARNKRMLMHTFVSLVVIPAITGYFVFLITSLLWTGVVAGVGMLLLPLVAFVSWLRDDTSDPMWVARVYMGLFYAIFPIGSLAIILGIFVLEFVDTVGLLYMTLGQLGAAFFIVRKQNYEGEIDLWYKGAILMALVLAVIWGFWGVAGYTSLSVIFAFLSLIEIYRFWLKDWSRKE